MSRVMVFDPVIPRGLSCNNHTSIAMGSPRSGLTTLDLQAMTVQQLSHLASIVQELIVARRRILDNDTLPGEFIIGHCAIPSIDFIRSWRPLVPPHGILQLMNFGTSYFLLACYSQSLYRPR